MPDDAQPPPEIALVVPAPAGARISVSGRGRPAQPKGSWGIRLIRLRQRRLWSRLELAAALGVSRRAIETWEQGHHAPPRPVRKLVRFIELSAPR